MFKIRKIMETIESKEFIKLVGNKELYIKKYFNVKKELNYYTHKVFIYSKKLFLLGKVNIGFRIQIITIKIYYLISLFLHFKVFCEKS